MKKILIIVGLLWSSSAMAAPAPSITISPTGPLNIFPSDVVSLSSVVTNCNVVTSISWYDPSNNILGVGNSISFQPTVSGNYRVNLGCKGVSVANSQIQINISTPVLDAGSDQSVTGTNQVNLLGNYQGFKGCQIDYAWTQISGTNVTISGANGTIFVNDNLSHNITGSFQSPATTQTLQFKLRLVASSCSQSVNSPYEDLVNVNVNKASTQIFSSTTYDSKMYQEAQRIFSDINLSGITLKLNYEKVGSTNYLFTWNSIGGEGYVSYILQASSNLDFNDSKQFVNFSTTRQLSKYDLDMNSDIVFFRLKAVYNSKSSPLSNTLVLVTNDLLNKYKVSCKKCKQRVGYKDALSKVYSLINKYLSKKCIKDICKVKY